MNPQREAKLLEVIEQQGIKIRCQIGELQRKDEVIQLLNRKIDLLARRVFGSSSEKLDPGQIDGSFGRNMCRWRKRKQRP